MTLVQVFRVFRILRLLKLLRLVSFFKELWLLVYGLQNTFRFIMWTVAFLVLVIYVNAIYLVQSVGDPYSETDPLIREQFKDLDNAMFNL